MKDQHAHTNAQGDPPTPIQYKSKAQQRRELIHLRTRHMLSPKEYYLYGFHERGKDYAYMLNFMTAHALRHRFRPAMNDPHWSTMLDNKWLFFLHYNQFDVPLPAVHGVYERNAGFTRTGQPLATPDALRRFLDDMKPTSLVIKPVGGRMGQQVLVMNEIRYDGAEIVFVLNTGTAFTFTQLIEMLDAPIEMEEQFYMSGGFLLQEKVEQHAFLNHIAPDTINTFRVVTFVDNGEAEVHFSILRLGRRGSIADNWAQGGISVAVDPQTGVLGAGVFKPKFGGQWAETHPDSGVRFTGLQVPCWSEIVACCKQAALVSPNVRSIGWDVVLTSTGPVILEANQNWDILVVQPHTHGYLQPKIREQFARYGLQFPKGSLPGINPTDWWLRLRERYRERRQLGRRSAKAT